MEEKTKLICLVSAFVMVFLCSCASPAAKDQPQPVPTISADSRAKMEQEAARIMEAEKETFDLLAVKMDEYQDTMALCESVSQENEESSIGTICRDKLRKLKKETEYLSGLLRREP
jgi:hypothetical protein